MSDNYDHPPASSSLRRPAASNSEPPPPSADTLPDRVQRLIDGAALRPAWRIENGSVTYNGELPNTFDRPFDLLTPLEFYPSQQNSETTPHDPSPSRNQLVYLRNLVRADSEQSRNPAATRRALEALNREIEEQRNDQAAESNRSRNRTQTQQEGSETTVETLLRHQDFHSRRRRDSPPSRSTLSPASSASDRRLQRQSSRPNFQGPSSSLRREYLPAMSQSPRNGAEGEEDRLKRRKLDTDDQREGMGGFNYGHYGQVVPGPLQMEIASCDGGISTVLGENSHPENILKDDMAEYCSQLNHCNLILQHRDEAPFALQKLVIKAPRHGFDSSTQEGMVFVSMTKDELLSRTNRYQISYPNSRVRELRRSRPSQEYLNPSRTPSRFLAPTVVVSPDSRTSSDSANAHSNVPDMQPEFRVTANYQVYHRNTIEPEFPDDAANAQQRLAEAWILGHETDDSAHDEDEELNDDDEDEDSGAGTGPSERGTHSLNRRRNELQRRIGTIRRTLTGSQSPRHSDSTENATPSLINPIRAQPNGESEENPSGETNPVSDPLKPHARFTIRQNDGMVTIRFEPAVSGRFILIKLWGPRREGSVNLESIIAHGYAGPRFLPSNDLR
ncbi:hypothetical protein N7532_007374 [Penicillium argentinense]|uniref:Uncharacterized protein n=1 Tax=Penicillium argentinense TaxID=1131581 RepID=A0A9W9K6L3_9EURO|nr:uncharacterized protein N7532_007374 [Penicillium argentinense]KAJ5095083.1 hypothetical protein N7532_007374 [Penicillium argentinense]